MPKFKRVVSKYIMAPHTKFRYDVVHLIQCVRERPCLWDKTLETYKDRIERKNAWEEIFNTIHEGYEDLSWEDKKLTGELIQNKWTNVRDTFVKSLKTKFGKQKRRYMFHDELKFLTKVVLDDDSIDYNYNSDQEADQDNITVTVPFLKQESEEASTSYASKKQKKTNYDEEYVPKKSKKKETRAKSQDSDYETYDPCNDSLNFVEVDSKIESDPRLMNEDEAFFASLLPAVVRYTEAERLEFRMEVLKVMKKLMEKKGYEADE